MVEQRRVRRAPRARRCPAAARRSRAGRTPRAPPPGCGRSTPSTDTLVETGGTVPALPVTVTSRRAAGREGAAADRCLGLRRQGACWPRSCASCRTPRSRSCCAATPSDRLREPGADQRAVRGPRRQRACSAISGDLGDDGLERRRATSTSSSTAPPSVSFEQTMDEALELNGKGPARLLEARARRRQRPVLHPRLDRLRRGPAHRPRAREAVRAPRRPSPGWTSTPSSTPRRAWRRDIEAESRLPVHQHRFVKEAAARGRPRRRPGDRHARGDPPLRVGPRPARRARPRARPRARLERHLRRSARRWASAR